MNIGFDLDKVFIDYPPIIPNWVIDKLYKQKDNGVLVYRIPGRVEQKLRQISHFPIFRKVIKNNFDFLKNLSHDKTHSLFLISSRFGFLKKQTDTLVKKHNFHNIFTSVYFNFNNNQPHEFKKNILKNLKLDRYIDDDLSLLKFLAKHFPNTMFYWLNSSENKQLEKNIKAIKHIDDLIKQ